MEMRSIGSLPASRIGLGLAALGRPGYINLGHSADLASTEVRAMESRTHEVLDLARSAGITYYDCARSYGRSEEFLASWLEARGIAPGSVSVGSKWGYVYTAGWKATAEVHEVKDHSRANLDRQLAESRELLGLPGPLPDPLGHAGKRRAGGWGGAGRPGLAPRFGRPGRPVGLGAGPGRHDPAGDRGGAGRQAVILKRAGDLNLLERSAGDALAEAHAAGLGVIVKEGLANGRLTGRNDSPDFAPARDRLGRRPGG
ncbi:MAG: aldo/keto reductase [Isosphaeraceae bacterium]